MKNLICTALLCLVSAPACHAEFPGWQGLRVIEQKGRPSLMRTADLNGDGREELIVVNGRSSRLDIYAWREPDKRTEAEVADGARPNELPMAAEFEHRELQLEQVPRDAMAHDLDGDEVPELVVLVASPNQVLVYRSENNRWSKHFKIDLLDGDLPSRRNAMLLRRTEANDFQLLVSMANGIQELALKAGGRSRWLTPREKRGRLSWWLADLDGDGRDDIVEQTRESNESLRWYRGGASGAFTPAAVLHDRAVKDAEVLRAGASVEVATIDGTVTGILRRFQIGSGPASPFGQLRPLALADGSKSVWCGVQMGNHRAMVVADSDSPRLLSYVLDETGWQVEQSYPAVSGIRAIERLANEPGTLLLWIKDGADLRKSRWEADRLTYPEPWQQADEERKILALDSIGDITWWVQKVGKDLDLHVARPGEPEARKTRFPAVGTKADQVLWLGGDRLLLKETHGRALNLVTFDGEKAKATSPAHLKKATLGEFKLFSIGERIRVGRLKEGVLQWLGDDLRSKEQVMLPQGQELNAYVAEGETSGWALQSDSPYVHRIEIDDSRLSRSVERIKVAEGVGMLRDPVLGMLLVGTDRVTHLSEGESTELELVDVIDERVARSGGVKKTRFHRLGTTDIDRDGYDDLVLFDELQHRLTVLGEASETGGDSGLTPKISWPVFDDKIYPYNDESDNLVKEPRAVRAADFDGDELQDLAILCHDRLLIYLARE